MDRSQFKSEKHALIENAISLITKEVAQLSDSAKAAHDAATHQESMAEDPHDTRGLEASYLAGAQSARLHQLKQRLEKLKAHFRLSENLLGKRADLKSLSDGQISRYFLTQDFGGIKTNNDQDQTVLWITPSSQIGEELVSAKEGDILDLQVGKSQKQYKVIRVY